MLKTLLLIFTLALPHQLIAQATPSYPRGVLHCTMTEGGADLTEDKFGIYSYRGTYGFDGAPAGGAAKIDLSSDAEKCTLKISAGDGAQKLTRSFSWTMNPSGIPSSIIEASLQDGDCRLSLRYSKSFGLCTFPTPSEPGNQCHGEAGKDLTAMLSSGNSTLKRKLIGYAGGMTIEVDPGSRKGIAVWRTLKGEGGWCYKLKTLFPDGCTKLSNQQEVKNSNGQIIGVLEPQKEKVLFKQAKQPYSETGFVIEPSAPSVTLMSSKDETNVIALGKNGAELGRLTVLGSIELPTRFTSFNRPAVDILSGGNLTSDCNGLTTPLQGSNPPSAKPKTGLK